MRTGLHVGDRGPAGRPRNGRALPRRGGGSCCPVPPRGLVGNRSRRPDISQPARRPRRADQGRGGRGRRAGTRPAPAGPPPDPPPPPVPGQNPFPPPAPPPPPRAGHPSPPPPHPAPPPRHPHPPPTPNPH